jgi:hypothetical protein
MQPARASIAALALVAAVAAACGPLPAGPAGGTRKPSVRASVGGAGTSVQRPDRATRAVPQVSTRVVTLVGKAKLLSDAGGGLLSDQGAAIISNNTGSLVANNGGGLVGKAKYGLAQGAAPAEAALADATITVLDAAGRVLVDAEGRPLQARTDAQGDYRLAATLPDENLLLRITLWNGGELLAIAARGSAQQRTVVLDTAATLGAAYVLDRYVQGSQATFDKLPASEAEALRTRLAAAQRLITRAPSYKPEESIALTESLRQQDAAVDETLEAIKVLLLGGLGDGRQATRVALTRPRMLALEPDGSLLVGEYDFGRVRRVRPDGTLETYIDGEGGRVRQNLRELVGMQPMPDGSLLLGSAMLGKVFRLAPDGRLTPLLGTGAAALAAPPAGTPAAGLAFRPEALAVEPDGGFWAAQNPRGAEPRLLLRVDAAGLAEAVALPTPLQPMAEVLDLAPAPGGLLYALVGLGQGGGRCSLHRRLPGGAWELMLTDLRLDRGRVAVDAGGTVYVGEDLGGRLLRLVPGEPVEVLAGPGAPAGGPTLRAPAGVLPAADGTLYVSDMATNVVHARSPQGVWRAVAGNVETRQTDASQLVFNTPAGLAFDPSGRLVVSEAGANAIKRWDGGTLETVAGGTAGEPVEDVPALEARFATLGAIAYRGDELIVADAHNQRLRAIGADGRVRSLTGQAASAVRREPLQVGEAVPAAEFRLRINGGLAVGPDGAIYWTSTQLAQVFRLGSEGMVRAVAGRPKVAGEKPGDGPDGPAMEASLLAPFGLAFKPGEPDNLYLADFGNARVRRIVGVSGPAPRIETVAGAGRVLSLLKLGAGTGWEAAENGALAREAALLLPLGLAFDPAGRLYVAETGTTNLKQLAANEEDFEALKLGADLPPLGARVRRIEPDGTITTLLGPGGRLATDPDAPDALGLPSTLGFDPQGRLAIVDIRTNSVRLVPPKALE